MKGICVPIPSLSPFNGIATSTFQDANSTWLEMVDGGSNGEVVPLSSLLVKSREMDVLVAVDTNSNDDNNWPKSVSLYIYSPHCMLSYIIQR